ncbi:hypothetical protein CARUB_v10013128mg [Capsella rubella]|uniref:Uncharacterized protein n=1 Tax=Capsella rubella TaxID=81985 RepID=R0G3X2_9BRAS|nr:uncharacterized protein LOC17892982 [Capsella rubella]XP_023642547.1 uncharacterized protein LOC17892982 [Capsella rubella]EOA30026.1 hypothetical protein CARUB_v10013128mg [Capsella rubella]EOA30027.1 hypothetical protein CARUB_v10013128mg [Capsella rubella]
MKFTGKSNSTATLPATGLNLKATFRRARKPILAGHRRSGVVVRRRSRPETPLSKPMVGDQNSERCSAVGDDEDDCNSQWPTTHCRERRRSLRPEPDAVRKLAAGVWRLQVPDAVTSGGDERSKDVIRFQESAGHLGPLFYYHHEDKHPGFQSNNKLRDGQSSVAATKSRFLCKHEPSIPFPHGAMEGATKWDPISLNTRDGVHQIYSNVEQINQKVDAISLASSVELKLEEARACIENLESEKRSQKKKLEQFLRKVSEERAAWRSREHEKVRAIIDEMKADMNRERKNSHRIEILNQKLVNELADSKLAVKRYMHDYQQERKAREITEEVCEELAKEIEEDRAEIEALKSESMNLREEVDDERRMLQMAEVWREERVQMKLIDAKVTLEDKYSQMNKLVEDLEAFLKARNAITGVKEVRDAELLRASVNSIQEIKEFTYEPAKPDDIIMLFEEMNLSEVQDREIKQYDDFSPVSHSSKVHTGSPDVNLIKGRHSNSFSDENGVFEEDDSGWETVSHPEEHGSSYSPDESNPGISNNHHRDNNVSMNGTEFQKTPLRVIKEVRSFPRRQSKKLSSMAKLWSSLEGMNGRVSNGRKSTVGIVSPETCSGKGGFSTLDLVGQWSSPPDSANANVNRGKKGCIEWPRGAYKNNLKTKLIEAQIESQKVQLKHVLEHQI